MRRNVWKSYWATAFILLFVSNLGTNLGVAQAPTATLVGKVVDSTNAAVVGAAVEVRNTATNQTRATQTGPEGAYTISNLPIGLFDVTISKTGFAELKKTGLELAADQTARLDAELRDRHRSRNRRGHRRRRPAQHRDLHQGRRHHPGRDCRNSAQRPRLQRPRLYRCRRSTR